MVGCRLPVPVPAPVPVPVATTSDEKGLSAPTDRPLPPHPVRGYPRPAVANSFPSNGKRAVEEARVEHSGNTLVHARHKQRKKFIPTSRRRCALLLLLSRCVWHVSASASGGGPRLVLFLLFLPSCAVYCRTVQPTLAPSAGSACAAVARAQKEGGKGAASRADGWSLTVPVRLPACPQQAAVPRYAGSMQHAQFQPKKLREKERARRSASSMVALHSQKSPSPLPRGDFPGPTMYASPTHPSDWSRYCPGSE